ncbi:MAG: carboxypeptidase-like regulatory domain-containing protein [Planctomycetota bacterium]
MRWLVVVICVAGASVAIYLSVAPSPSLTSESKENSEAPATTQPYVADPPVEEVRTDVVIEGTITDPNGDPVAGVAVELVTVDHLQRPVQKTGPDGKYRFEGYPRGHYWVGVECDGYQFINQSVVASLNPQHTFDFQLQRLAHWHGHVVDALNNPISGALVRLNDGHSAGTDSDGEFNVYGVAGDRFVMVVMHPDYGRQEFTAATLDELPARITFRSD